MQIFSIPGMRDRINVASWFDDASATTQFLARHVNGKGGIETPDWGSLDLLSLDANRTLISERTVWEGKCRSLNLEDPRARVSTDGRVLLGLTAVVEEDNAFVPYPAFCTLPSTDWQGEMEHLVVVKNIGPGKNLTPFTDSVWVYRKITDDFGLTVLTFDGSKAVATGQLRLDPLPPWASHKIGTAMPPVWINDTEALLILHGVTKVGDMHHYALGRARLVKQGDSFRITHIDQKPLLTPDDVSKTALDLQIIERHPFRRVVYCCGGIVRGASDQTKELSMYVNIGDKQTVEVVYPFNELTKGWW